MQISGQLSHRKTLMSQVVEVNSETLVQMPNPTPPLAVDPTGTSTRGRRVRHGWGTAVWLLVVLTLCTVVLVPVGVVLHVQRVALEHDLTKSDAIVVLGAAQYDGVPSPVLANRLDHAAELYRQGVANTIITVGGKQPGDTYTEAQAGKIYLVDQGIPAAAVVSVPSGTDTLTSMQAVATEMAEAGQSSATLVTDPTHAARTAAISASVGITPRVNATESGAGSEISHDYLTRESLGYLYHLLLQQWSVERVITSEPQS